MSQLPPCDHDCCPPTHCAGSLSRASCSAEVQRFIDAAKAAGCENADQMVGYLAGQLAAWFRWSGGTPPDLSPGDVIAAWKDGSIALDDGITTWNPLRALDFLAAGGTLQREQNAELSDRKETSDGH